MRKWLVALVAVFAFALLATSCSAHLTGGGFIEDQDGSGKANFGFNFQCDGEESKGHITYHDRSADLMIKGTVTGCDFGLDKVTVLGDYEGQGKSVYKAGEFTVIAIDKGEPGIGVDVMHIWLDGDDGPDYHNVGKLLGGNIQDH